ncbi:MAG: 30S ribosomal protein S6 [Proteobacteria bacterium]|nr:30S ribosomal protein S6 [Pseudomonadota bacterium]
MAFYESVFIARQDISTTQVDALIELLTGIVTQNGGQVTKKEYWGLKSLSYRIKKNRKGHYVLFQLDSPPVAVNELERNMRINEDVLRYLTIRLEEPEAGPSVMMQQRNERGDRGDRDRGDRDRGWRRDRDDRPPREDRGPREVVEAPVVQPAAEGGAA